MSENTTESSLVLSAIRGLREEFERRFEGLEQRLDAYEKRTMPLNETLINIDRILVQVAADVAGLRNDFLFLKAFTLKAKGDLDYRVHVLEERRDEKPS